MEDLKRLVFPAIAAIVLHGFLISFKLPKQETLKPVLKGNPIKIEINTFSPNTIVSKKKEEHKKAEIIPKAKSQKKVVQKKVIRQPVIAPKQQKKVLIEPEQTEKEVVIEDKSKDSDLQNKQLESQIHAKEIIEKAVIKQSVAVEHPENIENELEKDLSKVKSSIASLPRKAIPIYRENKQPPYPVMARRRGYEGEILLNVLVDAEGMVSEIKIKHSSGHLSLDRAALQSVKSWLFTPATEGGRRVAMWVDVPVDFQLK